MTAVAWGSRRWRQQKIWPLSLEDRFTRGKRLTNR